jgi:uncharacterized protein
LTRLYTPNVMKSFVLRSDMGRAMCMFLARARGEAGPESDIDFLVEMPPGVSLLDLGRFVMDLQDLLRCRVDVVEPEGLHWYIRETVLKEAVLL